MWDGDASSEPQVAVGFRDARDRGLPWVVRGRPNLVLPTAPHNRTAMYRRTLRQQAEEVEKIIRCGEADLDAGLHRARMRRVGNDGDVFAGEDGSYGMPP